MLERFLRPASSLPLGEPPTTYLSTHNCGSSVDYFLFFWLARNRPIQSKPRALCFGAAGKGKALRAGYIEEGWGLHLQPVRPPLSPLAWTGARTNNPRDLGQPGRRKLAPLDL